ncbi:hypothetical protein WA026_002420 [Henosepilachna vigintioctopunctata]|uniref:Uncharacterized protein n=1 Tax=Henosepilachna vigintioctopunctata TaxID=420089 RepID=A0AAW1U3U9_9CUCU
MGSIITKTDLLNKIDPSKLKLSIDSVKNIRNGGILINCEGNNAKNIISAKVTEEFGNKYNVEEAIPKKPKIAIIGAEEKYMNYENDQIIENIVDQNNLKENDVNAVNKIKIIRKYTVKSRTNTCNILLDIHVHYMIVLSQRKNSIWDGGDVL